MDSPARGFARRAPRLRRRARLAEAVRAFFRARGYLEVETSCAVPSPGEEVHLRAFETRRENGDGTSDRLWLRTSPEFAMKRLVAAGSGPIFQLARVWRNGEAGPLHAPEFTMLEWYAPAAGLDALMDETERLLRAVLPPVVSCRGVESRIDLPFERITVPPGPPPPPPPPGPPPGEAGAPLRFELHACGIELANAFDELTDPAEQRARFEADRARRRTLGVAGPAQDWPLDEEFLADLALMPACAGAALGFDRLAMLATGADEIGDVLFL